MIIEIECKGCREGFGIGESRLSGNTVVKPFKCPECGAAYQVGEKVKIAGITGGVNIKGSVTVHGDITGRDRIG